MAYEEPYNVDEATPKVIIRRAASAAKVTFDYSAKAVQSCSTAFRWLRCASGWDSRASICCMDRMMWQAPFGRNINSTSLRVGSLSGTQNAPVRLDN